MKTFLAALAAGLIGGGAAVAVIALNLVPVAPKANEVTAKTGSLELEGGEAAPVARDYDAQISDLKHQVEALEVQLSKAQSSGSSDEVAALRKELDELKKARKVVASDPVEGEAAVDVEPAPTVTPDFEAAVREVMTRAAEERAEDRRLQAQTQRLTALEAQKTQIAEFIPKLVANQAERLGIAEAVIPDVSNALVTHAQFRAELDSEIRGLKIDGEEIDAEAYKQKYEELNQTTIAALSSYVDQETAEKLVTTLDKAARNTNDGGSNRRPGQGGRRGGAGN
ncbi:MAG: hypothetical protein H6839_07680 [Planctomycetes bacterium]|nr:hypothetical protein [Planctomycetota bacterium]